jgi:hypothetical protein
MSANENKWTKQTLAGAVLGYELHKNVFFVISDMHTFVDDTVYNT